MVTKAIQTICPPREVRSFRVLLARDMITIRRPATRRAKLTVWDVLNISTTEGGKPGVFEEGQSFMVSQLDAGAYKALPDAMSLAGNESCARSKGSVDEARQRLRGVFKHKERHYMEKNAMMQYV